MNPRQSEIEIRRLAQAGRITLTRHARERDPGRGKRPLGIEAIRAALIHGTVVEGPAPNSSGGLRFTVRRHREGERAEVAGVLHEGDRVRVITGYATEH